MCITNPVSYLCIKIGNFPTKKADREALEELAEFKVQLEEIRSQEKLAKQGYRYGLKECFEPITKSVADTTEKAT